MVLVALFDLALEIAMGVGQHDHRLKKRSKKARHRGDGPRYAKSETKTWDKALNPLRNPACPGSRTGSIVFSSDGRSSPSKYLRNIAVSDTGRKF